MSRNSVTVEQDGKLKNIQIENLRINDLVIIQTGDVIPADLKLVEARALEIDEFDITGELLPVEKKVNAEKVILYQGARVTRGAGKGVVLAVGDQTEYGRIIQQKIEQPRLFVVQIIDKKFFGLVLLFLPAFALLWLQSANFLFWLLIFVVLSISLNFLQNDDLIKYLLVSFANGKLIRNHIQINDLKALERMGDVDTFCFDKTGVITTRQMNIRNLHFVDRALDATGGMPDLEKSTANLINLACALSTDVLYTEKIDLANPIDKAFISYAQKNGVNLQEVLTKYRRIYDQPFDSENRFMACGFETDGSERYFFKKGDPDVIINLCNHYLTSSGEIKKSDLHLRWAVKTGVDAIIQNGDTVIALAYKSGINTNSSPEDYTFLCLLQLQNSLQPGAKTIIQKLSNMGIRSLLLTGDKAETAERIGAESGITTHVRPALTGRNIETMEFSEIARQASYCSVFARLTPSQKGIIVRQVQQSGHCVAMVGDGPNDGIALKVADVGISFILNSSSIARKFSSVLINNLGDLSLLMGVAVKIKKQEKQFKLLRILIIVLSVLIIYHWALL
jgi:Ca2+-transporting ATPase